MTETLAIAIAQINPTVGDVAGNLALVRDARAEAAKLGADLVVTGELALCGYPPEDLVLKLSFQDRIEDAVKTLAAETDDGGPAVLTGAPWREQGKLYNAALLLDGCGHRANARPGAVPGGAPGRHGLRGHVVRGRDRMPGRIRGRDADRPQRLAL